MLTAKGIDGKLYTLPEKLSAEMISLIKRARPYYCPCCDTELVLKAGSIKIPHFAHKSNASCDASSEPESHLSFTCQTKAFCLVYFTWI